MTIRKILILMRVADLRKLELISFFHSGGFGN
jgi:hypothetical protein